MTYARGLSFRAHLLYTHAISQRAGDTPRKRHAARRTVAVNNVFGWRDDFLSC